MEYYPILLDLKGKKCVVVGGGRVAGRKVKSLLKAKAQVAVISLDLTRGLRRLKRKKSILHIKSNYQKKYLKGAFLAIAATSDQKINQAAARTARAQGILTNVVDSARLSNFIVPSSLSRGGLIISISTSGRAPGLSKKIKIDLSRSILPGYARLLHLLEGIRGRLKSKYLNQNLRAKLFNRLVNAQIPRAIMKNKSRIKSYLETALKDIEKNNAHSGPWPKS